MSKEEKVIKKFLCHGPLNLVLKLSRMLGVAPLTFAPEGIKVSLLYYLCSIAFIVALKTTIFVGFVMDVTHVNQSRRVTTTNIMWFAYQTVLTAVTLVGCFAAPKRCRSMIDALTRIEKISDLLGETKSKQFEVISVYATIFSLLLAVAILSLIDLYQKLYVAFYLNKKVRSHMFSFYYVEYVIELMLEFQFMIVVLRLTLILRVVNGRLLKLLEIMDKKKRRSKNPLMNNFTLSPTDSLFTFDSDQMKVNEEQSSEEIRKLWLVYELVCDLVRRVDRGYGLILLLLLQSFFLHFIMTPYYLINLYQTPSGVSSIGQQMAWFHFHAANVVLIVEHCHYVQRQMAKTRSIVTELMCQSRPYGSLSRSLDGFFKSLTLDQPQIAPLGMCVLERPLFITILGVVSAYIVPRHYFAVSNSDHKIFNNTNTPQ